MTPAWATRIVADAGIAQGDLVVDIGAGDGALTAPLLDAGARVIAVELNPERAATLRRRFRDQPVTVVRADAADLRLPRRSFRVVANPPFSAISAIVARLLAPGSRLEHAHLVLPRGAVRRWTAPDAPGAGRWHRHFVAASGRRIPRAAFTPSAPMDCATLIITKTAARRRR